MTIRADIATDPDSFIEPRLRFSLPFDYGFRSTFNFRSFMLYFLCVLCDSVVPLSYMVFANECPRPSSKCARASHSLARRTAISSASGPSS